MNELETALLSYLKEIEQCLEHKLYYAALSLTLAIPDIASTLEWPEDLNCSKKRYTKWLDKYFFSIHDYGGHSKAGDFYALRCAYLHNGFDSLENHKAREVVSEYRFFNSYFNNSIHKVSSVNDDEQITVLNTDVFCREIIESVGIFIKQNKYNQKIINETRKLMLFIDDKKGFRI